MDSNTINKTVDSLLSNISIDSEFTHSGGGAVLAMQGSSAIARGLAKAAFSLDAPACTQLIQNSLHAKGVVWTWEKLLFPVLFAMGKKWESSGQGIEAEHILSECITGQLKQIRWL